MSRLCIAAGQWRWKRHGGLLRRSWLRCATSAQGSSVHQHKRRECVRAGIHSISITGESETRKPVVKSPKGCANTSTMVISLAAGIPTIYFFYFPVCSDWEANIDPLFLIKKSQVSRFICAEKGGAFLIPLWSLSLQVRGHGRCYFHLSPGSH